jgi:hypothetical protein
MLHRHAESEQNSTSRDLTSQNPRVPTTLPNPAKKARVTFVHVHLKLGQARLSQYSDSLRAGRSGDRILLGGEIFRNRPVRFWGPPSLLYNEYRVFPGGKEAGVWR